MVYELKQELKLSQKLLLTPQLKLAIKLLQLSRHELLETVKQELEQNPVLEESGDVAETEPPPAERERHEIDWQEYLGGADGLTARAGLDFSENAEAGFYEKATVTGRSLREHLLWQLGCSAGLGERQRKICEFIIGNVDEHGYLKIVDKDGLDEEAVKGAAVEEIASLMAVGRDEAFSALELVQGFDPPGVCARTSKECLYLQASRFPERNPLVEDIVLNHLERLARRDYRAIAREMGDGVTIDAIAEAAAVITARLNPVPGAGFGTDEARHIVPDVFIKKVDNEYVVVLNDDGLPRLKISPYYRRMLDSNGAGPGSDARGYVQERLKSAMWFIKSVYQRQRTLKMVVESIVGVQKDFFDKGLEHLKPLVLKDVAEDIGMHESTVSRVTSNKYAETPRGIFNLKYFFSTAMSTDDGSGTTSEYIKERIRSVIEGEDPRHPLSDHRIAERLRESGMVLARRTVAKYREELGLLASSGRRKLY